MLYKCNNIISKCYAKITIIFNRSSILVPKFA